jgi:TctA family transporter
MADETNTTPEPAGLTPAESDDILKNRRRMAWLCIFAVLAMVGILFFYIPFDHISVYDSIFSGFLFFAASVVLSYMGSSVATSYITNYAASRTKVK